MIGKPRAYARDVLIPLVNQEASVDLISNGLYLVVDTGRRLLPVLNYNIRSKRPCFYSMAGKI